MELDEAVFGVAPEALDSVDVVGAEGKLIFPMIDPSILVEAQIDQPVVAAPAVLTAFPEFRPMETCFGDLAGSEMCSSIPALGSCRSRSCFCRPPRFISPERLFN